MKKLLLIVPMLFVLFTFTGCNYPDVKEIEPSQTAFLIPMVNNTSKQASFQSEEFLKKDYHFYALDLRKYGRSILQNHKANNVRDLSEYYEDIDSALAIIREEGSH